MTNQVQHLPSCHTASQRHLERYSFIACLSVQTWHEPLFRFQFSPAITSGQTELVQLISYVDISYRRIGRRRGATQRARGATWRARSATSLALGGAPLHYTGGTHQTVNAPCAQVITDDGNRRQNKNPAVWCAPLAFARTSVCSR